MLRFVTAPFRGSCLEPLASKTSSKALRETNCSLLNDWCTCMYSDKMSFILRSSKLLGGFKLLFVKDLIRYGVN